MHLCIFFKGVKIPIRFRDEWRSGLRTALQPKSNSKSWGFRGTTHSKTRNILSGPGNSSHAVCHAVCHRPLQQGHWLQKQCVFFFKRWSDIFAKLCKPFELTLLPDEVVLLLVLILSFPSLSLLWVMGQQDLAAGDRVHNDFGWECRLVQFLREQ